MNKLLACALLSCGLIQSVVACSDDDDAPVGTAGSSAEGGTSQAGKGSGGSSAGNASAGKSNGGSAGSAQGGTSGAGQGGKGGASQGGSSGTTTVGGDGSAGDSVGGSDDGAAGGGGEGGGDDGPPADPQIADDYWLNKYCDAKAKMTLGCSGSPEWSSCYGTLTHFLYNGGDSAGVCDGEADSEEVPKTLALFDAMDALAAACPLPMTSDDWQCDLEGTPTPKDQTCRDAEQSWRAVYKACFP